jgi:hypothetical protein
MGGDVTAADTSKWTRTGNFPDAPNPSGKLPVWMKAPVPEAPKSSVLPLAAGAAVLYFLLS